MARSAPDDGVTRELVQRALARDGAQLAWRCIDEIATVLGDSAEHGLRLALVNPSTAWLAAVRLELVDEIQPATIAAVAQALNDCDMAEHLARWMRRRVALEPAVVERIERAIRSDENTSSLRRALCDADLGLASTEMWRSWEGARPLLPRWRADALEVSARVSSAPSVPFLIAQGARCFVPGLDLQIYSGAGGVWSSEEDERFRAWRLPLREPGTSLVLVEAQRDRWREVLELVAMDLRDIVRSLAATEVWLRVPRFARVETRDGLVACGVDGPHPRMLGHRIGGLRIHDIDRPFVVVHWDDDQHAPLGVGMVSPRALVPELDLPLGVAP